MAFYDGSDMRTNFVISFTNSPKDDFEAFAKGYHFAAEHLAEHLINEPHRFPDYEAYPIVFLYRHAMELYLKHIIHASVLLAAFKSVDTNEYLKNTHDLKILSKIVKQLLLKLFPHYDHVREDVAIVEETCLDLSKIDPKSEAYRYPIDKQGNPSTERHQVVNLIAFKQRMTSVLEKLENICFGLDVETCNAQDNYELMQSILSQEFEDNEP